MYWSEDKRKKLWDANNEYKLHHPLVHGSKGMVVCTTNGISAHIGSEILRIGGNAADAVIATSLAQIVLAAGSYVSFAGIYSLMYYNAKEHKVYSLGAEYSIPKNESDPMSIPTMGSGIPSGRTALVPGFFAGIQETHNKFAKLPRKVLFEPAISLAEQGFEFTGFLESAVHNRAKVLSRLENTRKIFTSKAGEFYKRGDWFTQPDLANTLHHVVEQGSDYIYRGKWAGKFVEAVRREGGNLALEDMENYQVVCGQPVSTTYREYSLYGPSLPNYGGLTTLLTLNILEAAQVGRLGHYMDTSAALFWTIQAGKAAEIIHKLLIDSKKGYRVFNGQRVNLENVLSKETAHLIWRLMERGEFPTSPTSEPGSHSDAIVCIDKEGNMAAVTHTINAVMWGDTGLFVDGISIPDSASFQQSEMVASGAGNKLPAPTNPIIILKNNQPFMSSSGIGTGLFQKTYCALLNVLEYGMDLETSQKTPNHLSPDVFGDGSDLIRTNEYDASVVSGAKQMGLMIKDVGEATLYADHSNDSLMDGMWIAAQQIKIDNRVNNTSGITSKYFNGAASPE
jgi:gamma-glutamyltranspeptidase/glutathione hydrolase